MNHAERTELTRQTVDEMLALYRPGRTYDGALFLVNGTARVLFGGRPDRVRALIAELVMHEHDDVLPRDVEAAVLAVLMGKAEQAEAEPAQVEKTEPVDTYEDIPAEDGAELLDGVAAFLTSYCAFAMDEQAHTIALWIAHAHVFDVFTSTPRLLVRAPTIECGKTRVLEAIEPLVPGARLAVSVSGAYLFRTIGQRAVTILLDEYENVWRDKSDQGLDLRAIVDAGHRKGATVGRVVPQGNDLVPAEFPIFCPVALAGTGWLPESVQSRSITINMRRRLPDEVVAAFDRDEAHALAEPLRRRLAAWAMRNRDRLDTRPGLPEGLEDRPAEVWRPLFSVSALVGGAWPQLAEAACAALTGNRGEDLGTLLLVHIRGVFNGTDEASEDEVPEPVDEILSADLVRRLCAREDWPWAELGRDGLTAPELARRLRDFGMRPRQLKRGGRNRRGYERAQFREAWARFVPAVMSPDLPATSATPLPGRSEGAFRGSGQNEVAATPATSPDAATTLAREVAEVAEVAASGGDIAEDVSRDDGAYRMADARRAAGQPLDATDRAALGAEDDGGEAHGIRWGGASHPRDKGAER